MWLRDTWGAWVPQYRAIVLAEGLTSIQERCVLAHELEHAIAQDEIGCGSGPYADRLAAEGGQNLIAIKQERRADREACRKLIAISDLGEVARWAGGMGAAAEELGVTERMLSIRLQDLEGEGWPWPLETSKIAG
jgi:Zn-dependent peptidase ImmA (M78 family)